MKQYNTIKAKHPGALLLFRVGDFYETFGDDAIEQVAIEISERTEVPVEIVRPIEYDEMEAKGSGQ